MDTDPSGKTHADLNKTIIADGTYPTLVVLAKMEPERNLISTAIERLCEQESIRKFFDELTKLYCEIRKDGSGGKAAREAVGYMIHYYDRDVRKLWLKTLPDIYHIAFGRRSHVEAGEAFRAGKVYGAEIDKGGTRQTEDDTR